MPSPRERDYRVPSPLPTRSPRGPYRPDPRGPDPRVTTYPSDVRPQRHPQRYPQRYPHTPRHHYHDVAPWPDQRFHDYIFVDRQGWWPRWFPYWDPAWQAYWWQLYDYFGGDAYPDYAANARDQVLRANAPRWGLVVSGHWMGADPVPALGPVVRDHRDVGGGGGPIVRDHRGTSGGGPIIRDHRGTSGPIIRDHRDTKVSPPVVIPPPVPRPGPAHPSYPSHPMHDDHPYHQPQHRPRYHHPHDEHHDYIVVDGAWWPRWFPYWDPAWIRYWLELYFYYGGDTFADYAQYARDAHLRAHATQYGWRI